MYLHFSDWSSPALMKKLDKKSLPHGDKNIKIYGSELDPRQVLNKPGLFVAQSSDKPFEDNEIYNYTDRESYSGTVLENNLAKIGLSETNKRHIRALFRFSNSLEIQSCQFMMSLKNPDGSWMFSSPFDDIDGVNQIAEGSEGKSVSFHMDIFMEQPLAKLRQIVDLSRSELLVPWVEVRKLLSPERARIREGIPNIGNIPGFTK